MKTATPGLFHFLFFRSSFLIGCIFIVVGILATFLSWNTLDSTQDILEHGRRTQGTVVGSGFKERRTNGTGQHSQKLTYHITYVYKDDTGAERQKDLECSRQLYEKLRLGTTVPVAYNPNHPSESILFPDKAGAQSNNYLFLGVSILLFLLGLGISYTSYKKARLYVLLVQIGKVATGTITAVQVTKRSSRRSEGDTYEYFYSFTDQDGKTHQNSQTIKRNDNVAKSYGVNDPIEVHYDPRNPSTNALLFLERP